MTLQAQYTSGSGVQGGALLTGWKGALLKEWTLAESLTVGSGVPLTPVYFSAVPLFLSALRCNSSSTKTHRLLLHLAETQ